MLFFNRSCARLGVPVRGSLLASLRVGHKGLLFDPSVRALVFLPSAGRLCRVPGPGPNGARRLALFCVRSCSPCSFGLSLRLVVRAVRVRTCRLCRGLLLSFFRRKKVRQRKNSSWLFYRLHTRV